MPIATFAEFVAEQAVTIAIGAAAIAVAPKAGPKLAELRNDLGDRIRSVTASTPSEDLEASAAATAGEPEAAGDAARTGAAAVGASVAAAGRGLADKLASGAQKLGGQWSALVAEGDIESSEADVPEPDPGDLLSGLTAGDLVSFAPGRARLRLQALRGQPLLAERIDQALAALDGIRQVQANPTTGSVLMQFDARLYQTPDSLLEAISQL